MSINTALITFSDSYEELPVEVFHYGHNSGIAITKHVGDDHTIITSVSYDFDNVDSAGITGLALTDNYTDMIYNVKFLDDRILSELDLYRCNDMIEEQSRFYPDTQKIEDALVKHYS